MYQFDSPQDTITAIATPAGTGGLGIVRVSGKDALAIADRIIRLQNNKKPSSSKTFTVHYAKVINGEDIIDEALLTVMRGPKSYTAEDVVEISCHGGPAVVRAVLDLVIAKGARLASPGEFTKRAFLNGRIDLAQAEAVLDIIQAKTEAFARVSQNQLKGELSTELEGIRGALMSVYITVEALINFPEDDLPPKGQVQLLDLLCKAQARVSTLLVSARNGRILKEGIRIVLCGKPNVGKSSLLNVLLKQDRAIVTSIAGTTRDALEESAQIKGVPFQLVDTAGILEPRDLIEEEAIKRSHVFIDGADLVLMVLDGSTSLDDSDRMLLDKLQSRNVLFVLNKSDLARKIDVSQFPKERSVYVSATQKTSIDALEEAILAAVWKGKDMDTHGIVVSNIRHMDALKKTQDLLSEAIKLMDDNVSWEFIAQDVKDSINHLDSITGRNIDSDLLDRIFSEFCIGK